MWEAYFLHIKNPYITGFLNIAGTCICCSTQKQIFIQFSTSQSENIYKYKGIQNNLPLLEYLTVSKDIQKNQWKHLSFVRCMLSWVKINIPSIFSEERWFLLIDVERINIFFILWSISAYSSWQQLDSLMTREGGSPFFFPRILVLAAIIPLKSAMTLSNASCY